MIAGMGMMMAAALCAAAIPAQARQAQDAVARRLQDDRSTVLVASHRACWKKASENALDGIEICIADGIDMVEIDVRTTRDGALVLMHDETVDRTTNGHGAVADLTLAQVRALRLRARGGGANEPLTDRLIPTFAEALTAIRGHILMNIDVKGAALDRLIDAIIAAKAQPYVILNIPIDCPAIIVARARLAGIALQPVYLQRLSTVPPRAALRKAAALRPTSIQLIFDTPAVLDDARRERRDARLFVNTMAFDIATGRPMNLSGPYLDTLASKDPTAIWGALIAKGVTIIQTDEPWQLKQWLRERDH